MDVGAIGKLLQTALSAGIPGLIGGGIVLLLSIFAYFKLRSAKRDKIEGENEKQNQNDQASNAAENQNDQDRLDEAEDEVEKELRG